MSRTEASDSPKPHRIKLRWLTKQEIIEALESGKSVVILPRYE